MKWHLVESEHDAEEVDQDPEGVEDVMTVGTLVTEMVMTVRALVREMVMLVGTLVRDGNDGRDPGKD